MASSNTEHPYSNLSWNIPERKGYERVRSLWTKRQTIYRPPKQKLQQCHTLEPSNTKKPEHTKMTNYIFVEIETKTMSAETQHLKPDNNKKISFSMKQNKKKKREKWRRKPWLCQLPLSSPCGPFSGFFYCKTTWLPSLFNFSFSVKNFSRYLHFSLEYGIS